MPEVKKTNKKQAGRDPETAKILAQHLKNTPEDLMQETTYIPLKMVHVLSMLQALEGQFDKMLNQLIVLDNWRCLQRDPNWKPPVVDEDPDDIPVKQSHDLFIHRFRHALHQYFRGKDGLFLEKLVILADTDLQTRGGGSDLNNIFSNKVRDQ